MFSIYLVEFLLNKLYLNINWNDLENNADVVLLNSISNFYNNNKPIPIIIDYCICIWKYRSVIK